MSTEPKSVVLPATELLRQWKAMSDRRDETIRDLSGGIEETVSILRKDMSATMWFVDKTLKLLAAQEASTQAGSASERGTTG